MSNLQKRGVQKALCVVILSSLSVLYSKYRERKEGEGDRNMGSLIFFLVEQLSSPMPSGYMSVISREFIMKNNMRKRR